MQNPFNLTGKTILVTGASAGIGKAIAIACAGMGATVYITARNQKRQHETLRTMEGEGHVALLADLSEENEINELVTKLPKLDGVVHCAGVGSRVLCKSITQGDIAHVMLPNFQAPVLLQSILLSQKKINKSGVSGYFRLAGVCKIKNKVWLTCT